MNDTTVRPIAEGNMVKLRRRHRRLLRWAVYLLLYAITVVAVTRHYWSSAPPGTPWQIKEEYVGVGCLLGYAAVAVAVLLELVVMATWESDLVERFRQRHPHRLDS